MDFNEWRSEFISAYDAYSVLACEYHKALQVYKKHFSLRNRKRLLDAIQELKRQQEIIDLNMMMLID